MIQFFQKGFYFLRRLYRFLKSKCFIWGNRIIFCCNGVQFGRNMRVYDRLYLSLQPSAKLTIGDDFVFSSGAGINPLCRNLKGQIYVLAGGEIIIGNNSGISSACLWAKEKIIIGNNVNIGGDCIVMDTDAHNLDWRVRASLMRDENGEVVNDTMSAKSAPIIIEDNVLIGTRCLILKGVTIGARAIIAAGSVVTKSIPADCMAGGNPCKIIRYLNE